MALASSTARRPRHLKNRLLTVSVGSHGVGRCPAATLAAPDQTVHPVDVETCRSEPQVRQTAARCSTALNRQGRRPPPCAGVRAKVTVRYLPASSVPETDTGDVRARHDKMHAEVMPDKVGDAGRWRRQRRRAVTILFHRVVMISNADMTNAMWPHAWLVKRRWWNSTPATFLNLGMVDESSNLHVAGFGNGEKGSWR